MKSSELSNGENRIALWQLLQNRKYYPENIQEFAWLRGLEM